MKKYWRSSVVGVVVLGPDPRRSMAKTKTKNDSCSIWQAARRAVFAFCAVACAASSAQATDFVYVNNAANLHWQATPDGRVYFRNFSSFDATFLGCCYNYWLDTTTPAGKIMWSAILTKNATGKGIQIGVVSKASPSPVDYLGEW